MLEVLEPCLRLTSQAEVLLNGPLLPNTEKRADVQLPPGVVVESDLEGLSFAEKAEQTLGSEVHRLIKPAEEATFYAMGAEAGIGRAQDITLQHVGLPATALLVCQGGRLDTKGPSQKSMALGEALTSDTPPSEAADEKPVGDVVQCASKYRELDDKELVAVTAIAETFMGLGGEDNERKQQLLRDLGIDPAYPRTEWDGLMMLWVTDPNFVASKAVHIRTFDVNGAESTEGGKLLHIGSMHGRQVFAQEVPRIDKVDENGKVERSKSGKAKYVQPNATMLAAVAAKQLGNKNVGVVTSATYVLEEIVDAAEVAYDLALSGVTDMSVRPIAYGTRRMEMVTGKKPPKPSLAHVLGVLGKAQRRAQALKQRVN